MKDYSKRKTVSLTQSMNKSSKIQMTQTLWKYEDPIEHDQEQTEEMSTF